MSTDKGFFEETFDVEGLDQDQMTPHGPASLEVTASYGEFDGVTLEVTRRGGPDPKFVLVEVSPKGARRLIDAIAQAVDGPTESTQVPAMEDEDERAVVELCSAPDQFDGVYLGITLCDKMELVPLRLADDTATQVAAALLGALDYLAANGADITAGYEGEKYDDEVAA